MKPQCKTTMRWAYILIGILFVQTFVFLLIYFPKLDHRIDQLENPPAVAAISEKTPELYNTYTDFNLDEWIDYCADIRQFDPDLIRAIIEQESGWDPYATSDTDDIGLMQLHNTYWEEYFMLDPDTIIEFDLPNDPMNAYSNVLAGCNALAYWRNECQDRGYDDPIAYINCYNRGFAYFNDHNTDYSDKVLNRMLHNISTGD